MLKIHDKIRLLRKEKNWNQEEMAEKLGMSPLSYGKIERGETDYQSNVEKYLSKLMKITTVLDVKLEDLMCNNDKPICSIGNDNSGNFVIGSSPELAFEIQKQQLIIQHLKATLEQKNIEIANQKEIIELLKIKS